MILVSLVLAYPVLSGLLLRITTSALSRREDLTGRTDIWRTLLEVASKSPLLGVGYGGFWGLNPVGNQLEVGQGHNGFLDVYLELGGVGIVLLAAFFLSVCTKIQREFRYGTSWGVFGICFLLVTLIYNLSETAFFDLYLGTGLVMLSVAFSVHARGFA